MNEVGPWLGVTVAFPLAVIAASVARMQADRLRQLAVTASLAMLLTAVVIAVRPGFQHPIHELPAGLIRIDALSSILLPFAAALWLLTVAVTPRAALDRAGLRRTAIATLVTLLSFLTEHPVALLLLSAASVWTFLSALGGAAHRYQRRIAAGYLGLSLLLFAAGVGLVMWPRARGTIAASAGLWLIAASALVRKGIIPFHAWVPEVFDHGRLGPAILFSAPQLGAYITVVLIVPRASAEMLRVIALLALGTAVYGAALALVQRSARRACGYLFMSQSALVMAGLDCTSARALTGGLIVWLSTGLAFTGLARAVLVLEARRGRLDLTRYHGGYERMPLLAVSFLTMGLACTGFPGTLGFVGQELLVNGAVDAFPVMGFAIVIASALTGLAIIRMYFSLFCGRPDVRAHATLQLGLTRREAWTFGALVIALIAFGLAPRPLVDSRFAASDAILQLRDGTRPREKGDNRHFSRKMGTTAVFCEKWGQPVGRTYASQQNSLIGARPAGFAHCVSQSVLRDNALDPVIVTVWHPSSDALPNSRVHLKADGLVDVIHPLRCARDRFRTPVQDWPPIVSRSRGKARPPVLLSVPHQAGGEWIGLDISGNATNGFPILNEDVAVSPLVDVSVARRRIVPTISLNMHIHQHLHVRRKITPLQGPEQQMKVVSHDAVRQNPHRHHEGGLGDNSQKCSEIAGFMKERLAVISTIDDVLYETIRRDARMSRHATRMARTVPRCSAAAGCPLFSQKTAVVPFSGG